MTFFKKYLLPGFVFQSVVIGGGYGTGRELVEFFLTQGPAGGYFGMMVALCIWSVVMAVTFELARVGRHYDYRSFLNDLLGKGWLVYEIVYVAGLIIVISVIGSAASELLRDMFALPPTLGSILMMVLVGFFVFKGSALIEKALSAWSFALYAVYVAVIVVTWHAFGDKIKATAVMHIEGSQWFFGGVKYAAYNIGIVPAVLFATRHIERRKEAFAAGALAGVIAMLPGVLIYTAMLSQYPEVISEAVPANFLLAKLGFPVFQLIFQLILFGTFVETGIGIIHGFNERIAGIYQDRNAEMPPALRLSLALLIMTVAIYLAGAIGLVALIAKGYGTLTWGYWLVYLLPVMTVGVWRIFRPRRPSQGCNE